jgi:hypothetical protein
MDEIETGQPSESERWAQLGASMIQGMARGIEQASARRAGGYGRPSIRRRTAIASLILASRLAGES